MHMLLLVGIVAIAVLCRWRWRPQGATWNARWNHALAFFCLPPLLLFSASVAVLWMGHHGNMMGMPVSPLGCWLGKLMLGGEAVLFLISLGKAFWFQAELRRLPWANLPSGDRVRSLESRTPFAAQVGIWQSQVVVSRGWLEELTTPEQMAILRHEQAHAHYRDPFWFFWLGLLKRWTFWLPGTDPLWHELLLLREIRADRWAMQDTDPILLAELLVKLARSHSADGGQPSFAVAFCNHQCVTRLEQRIEALVDPASLPTKAPQRGEMAWIFLAVMPLILVCLHS
jgi:Zn-dependent protease with chaperone function